MFPFQIRQPRYHSLIPLITLGLSCSLSSQALFADVTTGVMLNKFQSQFPTIYLPSVGEVDRRRFKLPDATSGDPSLYVKGFEFTGVSSIDIKYLHQAFSPFEERAFTPKQLLELTDLITDTYRQHDIAAMARIPPQDAKNGTIVFEIHESNFVGAILDHGFEDHFNVSLERVEAVASLPGSEGAPLILSERERQQLLTIDMHGISISGGLQANDDGDQALELWIENSDRFSGSIDLNNQGLNGTGEEQAVLTSMLSSPFQRGGAGYLNAIKSAQSQFLSMAYRGPIGLRGTTLDLQAGRLSADTDSKRHQSISYSLGVRHPLIRTLGSNLFLSGIAEQRLLEESSIINNSSLTDSDYEVNTLRLTLDGNRALHKDRLTYRLQTTLGNTDLEGSPNRGHDLANANTAGAFKTFSGFLTYRKRLADNWQVLTHLQGQMSPNNLDDSQRLIAGGSQGLRGFSADELIVDQGALVRVDIIKRLNDQWRFGGFIDWAKLERRSNNTDINGSPLESHNRISAYDWGFNSSYRVHESLQFDLSIAQALSNTQGVNTEQGDVTTLLNLKWEF
ncbi:ShlB/FhaC/HecB family hemolysin secretion/activation protein [Marinobacterium sp. xm-d-564]|uniref:ShlB/FhaC/HecB family hemolysin secretion/activation protein n=1 Tax=Marinobacterium sp. xm-d-564 TaxID=2497742 RepID=UPI0015692429|nr:ShlB/FhaC/HecB family hemolysin secretion/activation protein [Marinobacterium sp. xm-d-564]NRP60567.1 Heme/hemopexin transporter protein HuxB precursor [Marinobacterium sp. xm-d-564]